jgi:hypothetical protein
MHQITNTTRINPRIMKNLTTLFNQNHGSKTPESLRERVLLAIEHAQARQARNWRIAWGTAAGLSFSTFAFSIWYAAKVASVSGFTSYLSIIFSDSASALGLWKELGLSLIESLPVVGLGILLASTLSILWSLRKFARTPAHVTTIPLAHAA